MFQARIELVTSLRSCLSQLLCHTELWLTVAQQKLFNAIPHNFEKRCKYVIKFADITYAMYILSCVTHIIVKPTKYGYVGHTNLKYV